MNDQDQTASERAATPDQLAAARLNGVMFMAIGVAIGGLGVCSVAQGVELIGDPRWLEALRENWQQPVGALLILLPAATGFFRFGLRVFRSRGKPVEASLQ